MGRHGRFYGSRRNPSEPSDPDFIWSVSGIIDASNLNGSYQDCRCIYGRRSMAVAESFQLKLGYPLQIVIHTACDKLRTFTCEKI